MICLLAWTGMMAGAPAIAQTHADPDEEHKNEDCKEDKAAGDARATEATDTGEGTGACERPVEDEDSPVVVNGKRPLNRIDRQSYDVTKDPGNATGTTAEALEKVPGVNVTPSGDVTLHGNSVDILVNGKPSPLFSGDNRAAALRAMPSGAISSIEVMSNPGAQYGSSSAAGIINIVTKRVSPPGMFGDVNGQVTSTGGYGVGGFLQYNQGRFATTAFLNASEYRMRARSRLSQAELDADGQSLRSTDNNEVSQSVSRSVYGNASVDYDAGPFDTLTGQFDFMRTSMTSQSVGATTIRNAAGAATDDFSSEGRSDFTSESGTVGVGWTRIGKTLGETLKVNARLTRSTMQSNGDYLSNYTLSSIAGNQGVRRQPSDMDSVATRLLLSADYNGYVGDDQLSAGFQIDRDDSRQDSLTFSPYEPGVGAMAANPLLSNRFDYVQTVNAAYMTYQKALGQHWVVLGGVRVEGLDYENPDAAAGAPTRVTYANINPSLFATYVLSDVRKIRLNYSRRLQRPTPYDLNPSLVYVNAQTVRVGEPTLKPQEINAFEASYEYAEMARNYSVRAYHYDNDRMINPVTVVVPDPQGAGNQVILVSRRNAGSSRQTGVQITYGDSFSQRWSVNANLDVYSMDMRVPDLPGRRSMVTASGQFGLNYMREHSSFSLYYYFVGKRLTGEGYMSGYGSGSLSWYRNLTPKITLTVAVNDLFKDRESVFVRNTGRIQSVSGSVQRAPVFELRISRRFAAGSFAPSVPEGTQP